MNILITGATGFIGSNLTRHLGSKGYELTTAIRYNNKKLPKSVKKIIICDLLPNTDWTKILNRVDIVIHLAARVHTMHDKTSDPLKEFYRINTAATLNLAQQASKSQIRRFIYLSSIKVNGENTQPGQPFKKTNSLNQHNPPLDEANNQAIPSDPYGLSKYKAEQGLMEIAQQANMEIVIIRPPLVYGPGVKGNFNSMMGWLQKGIPLPLGAIHNRRSLVALPNLIDLITTCIYHPTAANQTFLVSDGEDLSTTELLQRLGQALGKPAHLLPIPQGLLETSLKLIGKGDIAQRLCGNLQVDITKTKQLLDWTPPVSVDEALQQTAQAYLQAQQFATL